MKDEKKDSVICKSLKILSSLFLGLLTALIIVCFVYAVNQILLLNLCTVLDPYQFWIAVIAVVDGILIYKALYADKS